MVPVKSTAESDIAFAVNVLPDAAAKTGSGRLKVLIIDPDEGAVIGGMAPLLSWRVQPCPNSALIELSMA